MSVRFVPLLLFSILSVAAFADNGAESNKRPPSIEAQRKALGKLQSYVGQWRGVGQVRRGSRAGAWTETADIAWRLKADEAVLLATSPKAKYFQAMRFAASSEEGEYLMTGAPLEPNESESNREPAKYVGSLDAKGVLQLEIEKPAANLPDRIQVRLAAEGKRLVVLYERRSGSRFSRLAEVGFTRRGSGFGSGTNIVECVVTGGEGTIPVRFEGKTYYVCCSGCKEYFDDDPAKAMKEHFARQAEKKAAKASK